jgi:hypothetical protein
MHRCQSTPECRLPILRATTEVSTACRGPIRRKIAYPGFTAGGGTVLALDDAVQEYPRRHLTGQRVKFDLSVECAPEGGQVEACEGWKSMPSHRSHSIEFKRQVAQDPSCCSPGISGSAPAALPSLPSGSGTFGSSAILRHDDLLAHLQCASVVA